MVVSQSSGPQSGTQNTIMFRSERLLAESKKSFHTNITPPAPTPDIKCILQFIGSQTVRSQIPCMMMISGTNIHQSNIATY